jgi:ferredoxin
VCEPECPAEAIVPDSDEAASDWTALNAEYANKWPNITAKGESPADAEEWKGKADKKQHFSANPGSGS